MKRLLIISPYFPPSNTPDMQRIRMSLPYFKQFDWEAEVVTVDQSYSDAQKDELLVKTIPAAIKVHTIKAFNKTCTSKIGIGNIAFRSFWFYRKKVNELLRDKKFDLIYFSTTQFAVCVLGAYWKKRFNIPYVIDMQDPWHSEYYRDKPKHQHPKKYWFSYRLNKYTEQLAMKQVSGLISVSESYITDIKTRYPAIKNIPSATITFGSFKPDLETAAKNKGLFANLLKSGFKNIVYTGRGGADMYSAIIPLFKAFKQGLAAQPALFNLLNFYFIGTSYAPEDKGISTLLPLAKQLGVENNVIEITNRISYFHALVTLQQAHALFIPGSDDPKYTASKLYPYLMTQKPMLAIFNSKSPALKVLNEFNVPYAFSYDGTIQLEDRILNFLNLLVNDKLDVPVYNESAADKYDAQNITKKQCDLFDLVLNRVCV